MTSVTQRTVMFADLRGSTGLFERLGNAQAAAVVTQSVELLARVVEISGGRVIKTLGDGLMATFDEPSSAIPCADELHDSLDRISTAPESGGRRMPVLKLQVALAHGELVELNGDCFGDAVNVAARLLDNAGANETLVTDSVVLALPEEDRVRFRRLSRLQLRGRSESVQVHRLEAARFGDTVSTRFQDVIATHAPDGIRLVWLDENRVLSGSELPAVLGRSTQATFCIDDTRVSRSHARLEWHGGAFQISDLSSNGTYVRFRGQSEVIALRRGTCTLHGAGVICLGSPPTDLTAPTVRFEVLAFADTVPQAAGG
jgi:class 3 adenylate cyclase